LAQGPPHRSPSAGRYVRTTLAVGVAASVLCACWAGTTALLHCASALLAVGLHIAVLSTVTLLAAITTLAESVRSTAPEPEASEPAQERAASLSDSPAERFGITHISPTSRALLAMAAFPLGLCVAVLLASWLMSSLSSLADPAGLVGGPQTASGGDHPLSTGAVFDRTVAQGGLVELLTCFLLIGCAWLGVQHADTTYPSGPPCGCRAISWWWRPTIALALSVLGPAMVAATGAVLLASTPARALTVASVLLPWAHVPVLLLRTRAASGPRATKGVCHAHSLESHPTKEPP
jgi:hypothetical protein